MKRFSSVLRLTLWLVATFAIVFLAQAQRSSKRFAAPHQTMSSGHVIQIFDQNGQPAVNGVPSATSTIFEVTVAPGGSFTFDPSTVNISVGDTVRWTWAASGHSVTSGDSTSCVSDGEFCSPDNTNCSTCVTFQRRLCLRIHFYTGWQFFLFLLCPLRHRYDWRRQRFSRFPDAESNTNGDGDGDVDGYPGCLQLG